MKYVSLFLVMFTLVSCENIIENIIDNHQKQKEIDSYVSPYQGNWSGMYYASTGDKLGQITMSVSEKGHLSITRNYANTQEVLSGWISDSGFFSVFSAQTAFKLSGNLKEGKGSWTQYNNSGTYTIARQ